jgi:hypothetical protein
VHICGWSASPKRVVYACTTDKKSEHQQTLHIDDKNENKSRIICNIYITYIFYIENRGSAVGTAPGYGLHDRGVGFRDPVSSRIFTSPYHPEGLWANPAFCPMGTWGGGGTSPGVKWSEREADH